MQEAQSGLEWSLDRVGKPMNLTLGARSGDFSKRMRGELQLKLARLALVGARIVICDGENAM